MRLIWAVMPHAIPFSRSKKTGGQKLKVGGNKNVKMVHEKLPICLVTAGLLAPCWTTWEAHFLEFFEFHIQVGTSRSVFACGTIAQTLPEHNAGQTARYWRCVLTACTPETRSYWLFEKKTSRPSFWGPSKTPCPKKLPRYWWCMHGSVSGPTQPWLIRRIDPVFVPFRADNSRTTRLNATE